VAKWITRSLSQVARNGTTAITHTFTPASAGSLLYAVCVGSVTYTLPTGWTLVNSAVNNGVVYVWRKTATAGESSFATTGSGSNFPSTAVIYEFASGSTVGSSAQKINSGTSSFSGAALTGLGASAKLIIGTGGHDHTQGTIPTWSAWSSSAVEDVDNGFANGATPGHTLGVAYLEDSVLTGWTPTATITGPGTSSAESVVFSVNVAGATAPALPIIVLAPRR
jgi:hypothetical protein